MSPVRESVPGATRNCPHCRTTILESAVRCPKCQHHLRFDSGAAARAQRTFAPLRVEGTLRHADGGDAWEYSVLLTIRNERGEEVARQVMGVGALAPGNERTFSLSVEVYTPEGRPGAGGG
ncbi:MAG: hypothetical protein IPF87_14380 [Gemmatimonadetes bacterium]|jgi:hypothetical protein|nr:hypothetical protein [Gemmatimonadota bacterium]MBK7830859.1 hypothetical protein [Gemmatimonadota bacterium]